MAAETGKKFPEHPIVARQLLRSFRGKPQNLRHILRKADLPHALIVFIHTNVHICFAEHIGHFLVIIQKTLFHPIDIAAQF